MGRIDRLLRRLRDAHGDLSFSAYAPAQAVSARGVVLPVAGSWFWRLVTGAESFCCIRVNGIHNAVNDIGGLIFPHNLDPTILQ